MVWVAADTASSGNDQLVIILGGILVAAITAGGTVLVAMVNSRANRTTPSPPSPSGEAAAGVELAHVREELAVLRYRADDSDERDEMQDRRLDQIERVLDIENPNWRHDGRR